MSLRHLTLLAVCLSGCHSAPPPEASRQPAPLPLWTRTPEPQRARTLQTRPAPRRPRPVEVVATPVAVPQAHPTRHAAPPAPKKQLASPKLPAPPVIPTHHKRPPAVSTEVSPTPSAVEAPDEPDVNAPIEVEVVPPPDWPKQPPDPQSVLTTPEAPHFGYTYSRSLLNLVRDGNLDIRIVATGHTNVAVHLSNPGRRALHMYLFPGMIFKPKKTGTYSPLVLATLQDVTLYPGATQQFSLQCYSLDRKKPLPDERNPILYRLEPDRDPRFPRALRVLQAMLAEEALPEQKHDYQNNRPLIVQFALWQATSGRYDPSREFAREIGPVARGELQERKAIVFDNVGRLMRAADAL